MGTHAALYLVDACLKRCGPFDIIRIKLNNFSRLNSKTSFTAHINTPTSSGHVECTNLRRNIVFFQCMYYIEAFLGIPEFISIRL